MLSFRNLIKTGFPIRDLLPDFFTRNCLHLRNNWVIFRFFVVIIHKNNTSKTLVLIRTKISSNDVWKILGKNSSFRLDQTEMIVAMGNSCFGLSEMLNVFSPESTNTMICYLAEIMFVKFSTKTPHLIATRLLILIGWNLKNSSQKLQVEMRFNLVQKYGTCKNLVAEYLNSI